MTVLSIVLQSLLILYYVFSGTAKIMGAKYWSEMFAHLQLPQWFRVVTGAVQLIGAALLIAGYWYSGAVAWAGVWLGITMLLACFTHLRIQDPISKTAPAIVFAALNAALLALNAGEMFHPFA